MLKHILMILFKNAFFVMSVSGTVVFVFYMLFYPLCKRYVSLKWRYGILKTAMVFYLVPFPLWKYRVWGFFYDHVSLIREIADQHQSTETDYGYIIVVNPDSTLLSPKVQAIYLTVLLILLISFFILWKHIMRYRKMKQLYAVDLSEATEGKLWEFFSGKKAMLNIKRKVKLVCSEYCESPITMGALTPTVLFPPWDKDSQMEDELWEYMITHELVHIKHNDILIKSAGLLVLAVHWFNPFAYLLVGELSCISEMYCDSVVMAGKGEEERRKYGNLLLKLMAENASFGKGQLGVGFANFRTKERYKRRILELKGNKKYKTVLSAIVAAFICVAGSMAVFAYSPPSTLTNVSGHNASATDFSVKEEDLLLEKLVSDYYAVSGDGTVYDFCRTMSPSARVLTSVRNSAFPIYVEENDRTNCKHAHFFVQVEVTKHMRNSNGCIINVYEGFKCTKCNDVTLVKLKNIITFKPCPH